MQGTPQGGILSPLVWNLAFDDLFDRFNSGPACIKGFADAAAIILRGPDIYTLIELGQEAISKALDFGCENGLEFGADRTEVVVFTCKRLKTSGLPYLHMANRDVIYWASCHSTCTLSAWQVRQRAGSRVRTRTDGMASGMVTFGATFSGAIGSWNRWT